MDFSELLDYRKKRVQELVDLKYGGSKAALGRAMGFRDGAYIGQMISGLRSINEKTIRQLEALPGVSDWFTPPNQPQATSQAPPAIGYAIGSAPNVLAFADKVRGLPETQRKYLAMLLSDLVLQPDKAPELAPEIARLLGEQAPGKPLQLPSTSLKNGSNG